MSKPVEPHANSWAVITGGYSGIGLGFARAYARRGYYLLLVARNERRLQETANSLRQEFGVPVAYICADLATQDGLSLLVETLKTGNYALPDGSFNANITVLVNNAGCGLKSPMATTDETQLSAQLAALNLMVTAPFVLGTVAARVFNDRLATTATGSDSETSLPAQIINVASVNALVPMSAYSAMKSFIHTWSQALSLRMNPRQVQVVTFVPGWTRTEHHQRAKISTTNIPERLWLDANLITEECVARAARGQNYIVPKGKYRAVTAAIKCAPRAVIGRVMRKFNKGRGHNA